MMHFESVVTVRCAADELDGDMMHIHKVIDCFEGILECRIESIQLIGAC
jgi:hypothetical protein